MFICNKPSIYLSIYPCKSTCKLFPPSQSHVPTAGHYISPFVLKEQNTILNVTTNVKPSSLVYNTKFNCLCYKVLHSSWRSTHPCGSCVYSDCRLGCYWLPFNLVNCSTPAFSIFLVNETLRMIVTISIADVGAAVHNYPSQ
jgi:hypothetical protein